MSSGSETQGKKLESNTDRDELEAVFDETWYLKTYPDVAKAIADDVVKTALEHYRLHGAHEGRKPSAGQASPLTVRPITLLHIPKTAGTSVRSAFLRAGKTIFEADPNFQFEPLRHGKFNLISGHFGYRHAKAVGGDIITLLRDPIDRFLSYYYHLKILYETKQDVSERTLLSSKYSIDDFILITDSAGLIADQFNAVTWQLAFGSSLKDRFDLRSTNAVTEDQVLRMAMDNLSKFRIVGFQHDIGTFCQKIDNAYQLSLRMERENANPAREHRESLKQSTIKRIYDWVYLDLELYHWACHEFP